VSLEQSKAYILLELLKPKNKMDLKKLDKFQDFYKKYKKKVWEDRKIAKKYYVIWQ